MIILKAILLDIDGVLNTGDTTYKIPGTNILMDIYRLIYVKRIMEETGAKIVSVSSITGPIGFTKTEDSFYANTEPAQALLDFFKEQGTEIYDIIQRVHSGNRQKDIDEWLQNHDIESFVIIDDDVCVYSEEMRPNIIKTSNIPWDQMVMDMRDYDGLKEEQVYEAIEILNRKEKILKK